MNRAPFMSIAGCILLIAAQFAHAGSQSRVGMIQEIFGDVTVTRAGDILESIDIGDYIENFDLISTGSDGELVIGLDAASGMRGTLAVKPKSVFTVKTETIQGADVTEGDVIGGAVAVKVKKLAGNPTLRVRTGSAIMGVRGTQFEVLVSVNDSLLVACSEGRVACFSPDGDELEAEPGQAVLQAAGDRLRRVPVAVSDLASFRDNWISDEIEVFKASPLSALDQYVATYKRYVKDFLSAYSALATDENLSLWMAERRKGVEPRANDPAVMRQKSALAPKLMTMRRVMFLFERVYYRLDEVRSYVGDKTLGARLSSGQTVSEFYNEFARDRSSLERKAAVYRFALSLYAERNDSHEPVSLDEDTGEFFDDISGFFN